MTTFEFPDGIKNLKLSQIKAAVCKYEKVVFPGSMTKVELLFRYFADKVKVREIELHEGVQYLSCIATGNHDVDIINVPNSILEMDFNVNYCMHKYNFILPKVVCLPIGARKLINFTGVEYLQAYSHQEIRFYRCDMLKHYVYLGEGPSIQGDQFDYMPSGSVLHVQSLKTARDVLKKVDVEEVYVVADADDWKDFPADKLNLTMEEYDPESRILPEQIKLRVVSRKEKEIKAAAEREKIRAWEEKEKIRRSIEESIRAALHDICTRWEFYRSNNESRITVIALTDELKMFKSKVGITGTFDFSLEALPQKLKGLADCITEIRNTLLRHDAAVSRCIVKSKTFPFENLGNLQSAIITNCHGSFFIEFADKTAILRISKEHQSFIVDLEPALYDAQDKYGIDIKIVPI